MNNNSKRNTVIWVGSLPVNFRTEEFERRGLQFEVKKRIEKDEFCEIRGIIFSYNHKNSVEFKKSLVNYAEIALEYGIALYSYTNTNLNSSIPKMIEDSGLSSKIYSYLNTSSWKIAEEIARLPVLMIPNEELVIIPNGNLTQDEFQLNEDEKHLLRISFGNCKSIDIILLSGGLSGRSFLIHAEYIGSARKIPLPFFAKIDKTINIMRERNNYNQFVHEYVPFYLRPNYIDGRCINGNAKGIVVGNFVEVSEPLMDVAKRGHSHAAINSLLDVALYKWHLVTEKYIGNLAKNINGDNKYSVFNPNPDNKKGREIALAERYKRLMSKEVKLSPNEILNTLYSFNPTEFTRATIHGDLHGYNVMVRNGDAILIDFDSIREWCPIICDFASLEVSLVFNIEDKDDINNICEDNWKLITETLYSLDNIENPSGLLRGTSRREWQWSCVKQIRIRAITEQLSEHQYAIALIMNLMRRATYPSKCKNSLHVRVDDDRSDYAYMLAEKLTREIANNQP